MKKSGLFGMALLCASASSAMSETLSDALLKAYGHNPGLNAGRANMRAVDEGVPLAKAGMRPRVSINSYLGAQKNRFVQRQDDLGIPDDPNRSVVWNLQQGKASPVRQASRSSSRCLTASRCVIRPARPNPWSSPSGKDCVS